MNPLSIGSTSAPALHPDLAPGAGQLRDDALDADAQSPIPAPAPPSGPTASEEQAEADVDAAIAAGGARADVRLAGQLQPVLPPEPSDAFAWARRLG